MIILTAATMILLTACVFELDNAGSMVAGTLKEYRETVEMSDKYNRGLPLELNLEMKMAKAVLDSTDEKLADVKFSYSSKALKPEFKVGEDEISIRNRMEEYSLNKAVNNWDVKITDKMPLEIEVKADASDARLDMSRMQINSIDAELNASSAKMYFDKQNRMTMGKFRLNADASSADIYGAGSLDFDIMDINADASKLAIDLTGDNGKGGKVRIDANASSVKLRLPEDADIHIVIDKYGISSVNINNERILNRSQKEYISKNYGNAARSFEIYANLNITSLTIE
ncbi:MAG: toast rack family protein [Lutisporaceae bacterium]|jgi:hypothetical protein